MNASFACVNIKYRDVLTILVVVTRLLNFCEMLGSLNESLFVARNAAGTKDWSTIIVGNRQAVEEKAFPTVPSDRWFRSIQKTRLAKTDRPRCIYDCTALHAAIVYTPFELLSLFLLNITMPETHKGAELIESIRERRLKGTPSVRALIGSATCGTTA